METLTLLMQAGAMLDARRCDDFLPVHVAASKGSTSILALLLDAGAYPDATHRLGWTALHFAAHQGHVECMDLLVTKGANLDSQANDGCTPLMLSILFKQPAALKFLLEKGADRHLVNNQGYSAESFALQHDNVEAQAMLSHAKEEVRRRTAHSVIPGLKSSLTPDLYLFCFLALPFRFSCPCA